MIDRVDALHHGESVAGWSWRTAGTGVLEGREDHVSLLPFAESTVIPDLIIGQNGTPPTPVRVHRTTGKGRHGEADHCSRSEEVDNRNVTTATAKWNSLCSPAMMRWGG